MHIERIEIHNFKLFDNREFIFHPHFNLVVGVNGKGKTSLLEAIAKSLSSMMKHVTNTYELTDKDFRLARIPAGRNFRFETQIPISVKSLVWDKNKKFEFYAHTNLSAILKALSNKEEIIYDRWRETNQGRWGTLPIICFYPCNRPWLTDKTDPTEFEAAIEQESRLHGYRNWFNSPSDYPAFKRWVISKTLERLQYLTETGKLESNNSPKDELDIVSDAVASCLEGAKRIHYDFKQKSILVEWDTGEATLFDHLSDGQRTLLAMVADIARRACLLNPHLGDNVLTETPGIVLIDELDLHLHPKWQRRIIGDLRRTFPQIQFICTTHSPQLIGECQPDEIILLDEPEPTHPGASYGMDSNWILRHVMGGDERDPRINTQLDAIYEAIEDGEFEEAKKIISELRRENAAGPDLVEAEAVISRYTRFADDGEE